MGVSAHDIFGGAGDSAAALPGSYGEQPSGFRLPATTKLGLVKLQVSSLERSLAFYEEVLGMRVFDRTQTHAVLGAFGNDFPLVELHEFAGAKPVPRRGRLGLFHFAILLPDRPALGRFLQHLGDIDAHAGAADHLVSEALYLQDPDNLGIEIYADRPRDRWRRVGRALMMATDPLDAAELLQAAGGEKWAGMPAGTTMGHVHLHVGDIAAASAFFFDVLGFDRTVWEYPGALFLGAGGYHHHLGTNTWAGANAVAAAPDEAHLKEWTIILPDAPSLAAAEASLRTAGFTADRDVAPANASSVTTQDPWGTRIRLTL